ncbi:NAD-binding protein [Streptomyces ovatisporus]|uniref:NAD-binding protein n=1 Tax=Streptomyces ovatisporus TaxID=1128682 RepID=A0ABV9A1Z1_9ACTN
MDSSLEPGALRGHMVVCGDNALAQRVCKELATVYGQHVTVVLPSLRGGNHGPQIAELVGAGELSVDAVEARVPDDTALISAGIERASALALTSGDDQLNIYIALRARRLNPQVRLVIRMFNQNLGRYLADLLDRAARLRGARASDPVLGGAMADATTTVLSDSDTAAPSIVAAAVVGSDKILYADGLLLRAKERTLRTVDRRNPLCTLALLPSTDDTEDGEGTAEDGGSGSVDEGVDDSAEDTARDPADGTDDGTGDGVGGPTGGAAAGTAEPDGQDAAGERPGDGDAAARGTGPGPRADRGERHRIRTHDGPVLLPDEEDLAGLSPERGAVVLEAITRRGRAGAVRGPRLPRMLALKELFSRRLRYSLLAMTAVVLTLATVSWAMSGETPLHAGYVTLLDVFAINEPNLEKPAGEQILQLLAALAGMMLLPLLLAVVLESYGAFRKAAALPNPPRGLSGHVVLVGLGKVGKHVLERLLELNIPVLCIERDPEARGIALARRRRVPTLIADVTDDGVLEEAKIKRSRALLALTSTDGINLEASLNARQIKAELRVVMRLFDDQFAATVYRTLRDTYPAAQTRSRSVSALAAPAFAGAMMGRQVLGAISVGRRVLVFATVEVRGNPLLEGRTVATAFRAEAWRVVALDTADEDERRQDLSSVSATGANELEWRLHPGYVLQGGDRVVVAATRRGLSRLLAAGPASGIPPVPGTGEHRFRDVLQQFPSSLRQGPPQQPPQARAPEQGSAGSRGTLPGQDGRSPDREEPRGDGPRLP